MERLPSLRGLLKEEDDYARFTHEQRAQAAVTVSLATAAVAVMSTSITDEEGEVTDISERVVADARARLGSLVTAQ
ncbi:hypothetical protein ACOZ38_33745 [Sphaerisporangium viridialbum]|uniref:hypothetical protein n=1 Tax=Sphaerisporangium viridialbum TaxID=46189 RepID=UPI003C737C8D